MIQYLKNLLRILKVNEQKNLFLAIGLSILIIVAFQFLFPQQAIMTPSSQQTTEQAQQAPSTDEQQQVAKYSYYKIKRRSCCVR